MNAFTPEIYCPRCEAVATPTALDGTPRNVQCPSCQSLLNIRAFPALLRPRVEGPEPEPIAATGKAACFQHDELTAVAACEACGKFLCSACAVHAGDADYCGPCLDRARAAGDDLVLPVSRPLHANRAVALALAPIPLFFIPVAALLTAPLAIVTALRTRTRPGSLILRDGLRRGLAIALAGLQLVVMIVFLIALLVWS